MITIKLHIYCYWDGFTIVAFFLTRYRATVCLVVRSKFTDTNSMENVKRDVEMPFICKRHRTKAFGIYVKQHIFYDSLYFYSVDIKMLSTSPIKSISQKQSCDGTHIFLNETLSKSKMHRWKRNWRWKPDHANKFHKRKTFRFGQMQITMASICILFMRLPWCEKTKGLELFSGMQNLVPRLRHTMYVLNQNPMFPAVQSSFTPVSCVAKGPSHIVFK